MALEVRRSQTVARAPADVWQQVRDFCAPWHPAIATMTAEESGQVRAFTVTGEETTYRERLVWFSDSEMSMAYRLLEGIAGADRYQGSLSVDAVGNGARITMAAEIDAPRDRAKEIAEGTASIFDMGLSALGQASDARRPDKPGQHVADVTEMRIEGAPELALSVTPTRDGPLCLFLHGIGGNRINWTPQLGLAGRVTRAAALDLRGYGSSALGPEQSTLDAYCADILRVAEALGHDKLILCGLSYGAWIATAFAETYPERLAGLILSGGCTGMSEADAAERDAFRQSREVPLNAGQAPADFASGVVEVIAGPNASEAVRSELHASMAAIPAETYRDALTCFTNPPRRFDFSRLTMPVLMMTGEHDRLAPPLEIHGVARRIFDAVPAPDVRFEVIKGAGHLCNLEAPELYNAPMMEFLTRVAQ